MDDVLFLLGQRLYLFICLYVYQLFTCLSLWITSLSIYLSVYLSICLSVCLSVCLSAYLSPSVCLPTFYLSHLIEEL